MLTERKERILKIIVGEYVSTATPVGSESIARKHELGVSPATIRNDMAYLEEEGYIAHPHPSAGRIPSDKGYRYYVDSLIEGVELPLFEQRTIRHQFHQVETDLEEWVQLAAATLARMVQNVALVTFPKATLSRFRRMELVAIQEFLALLIVVLQEAKIKKQMLPLDEALSQEELSAIANKLNAAFEGLSGWQITAKRLELSAMEEQVVQTLVRIMQAEDDQHCDDPYLDGLRHILSQPEFADGASVLRIMEVFEDRSLLKAILPQAMVEAGVQVVIGEENMQEAMRHCSVVLGRYGVLGEATGVVGVVGPTRMRYGQAISIVRYLGQVMSELVAGLHGERTEEASSDAF